jgi:hypothetical protein
MKNNGTQPFKNDDEDGNHLIEAYKYAFCETKQNFREDYLQLILFIDLIFTIFLCYVMCLLLFLNFNTKLFGQTQRKNRLIFLICVTNWTDVNLMILSISVFKTPGYIRFIIATGIFIQVTTIIFGLFCLSNGFRFKRNVRRVLGIRDGVNQPEEISKHVIKVLKDEKNVSVQHVSMELKTPKIN